MIDRSTLGGWLGVGCWGALTLGALFDHKQRERESAGKKRTCSDCMFKFNLQLVAEHKRTGSRCLCGSEKPHLLFTATD